MAELILEPYCVEQHWSLSAAGGQWPAILGEYLEMLAQGCCAAGPCVIGHIKALSLFANGGYLRVSVVAPGIPASLEGQSPPGCTSLDLTVNMMVYGLQRQTLERIALETAAQIALQRNVEVTRKEN